MKIAYKNVGHITKTFHGVTFKPGESKEVDNFINDSTMIRTTIAKPAESGKKEKMKVSAKVEKSPDLEEQESDKIESENKEEESDGTDKHQRS